MYDELWCALQVYRSDGFWWFCLQLRFATQGEGTTQLAVEFLPKQKRGRHKKNGRPTWRVDFWLGDVTTFVTILCDLGLSWICHPHLHDVRASLPRREAGPVICHEGPGDAVWLVETGWGHTISMVETQRRFNVPLLPTSFIVHSVFATFLEGHSESFWYDTWFVSICSPSFWRISVVQFGRTREFTKKSRSCPLQVKQLCPDTNARPHTTHSQTRPLGGHGMDGMWALSDGMDGMDGMWCGSDAKRMPENGYPPSH